MSDFKERNVQCILEILKKKNPATTKEIMAMRDLFPDLCAGCSSGGDVILAVKQLVEEGTVQRKWKAEEGFEWKLLSDPVK
ncbi:MAG: hypothetical protein H7644_02860 [Candidatus Heimdallarchaeota archaeon]|nr:hypothetical protein [Candidatus Heimdallarchaeota archaeon]MCK5142683.1 hypothetical protein [Candidatus Heimdallarchaeota archaeon]